MSTNRYSSLLEVECPEIEDLSCEIGQKADLSKAILRETLLRNALETFKRFTYVDTKGILPVEDAARNGVGNCISLSCLMALTLEKVGVPETEMYIAIGVRTVDPARLHAYLLVRGDSSGEFFLIDPEFRRLVRFSIERFLSKYRVHVIFNRNKLAVKPEEKQSVLERLASIPTVSVEPQAAHTISSATPN